MEERRVQCVLHEKMLADMSKQIAEIHKAIYGNGHPENSLMMQANLNTRFRLGCESMGRIIINVVLSGGVLGAMYFIVILSKHGFIK